MIINDLNKDVMLCIYDFVSFAEMWSLSRTCSGMYNMINPNLYRMFINSYYKIQPSFINERRLFDAYFKNILVKYEWCIFTGSSILSVLLGKNWHGDIDMFFKMKKEYVQYFSAPDDDYDNTMEIISEPNVDTLYIDSSCYSTKYISENDVIFNTIQCYDSDFLRFLDCFDINACKSYLDVHNKVLHINNPSDTLFFRSSVNSGGNDKTFERACRYTERGFVLYSVIRQHYKRIIKENIKEHIENEIYTMSIVDKYALLDMNGHSSIKDFISDHVGKDIESADRPIKRRINMEIYCTIAKFERISPSTNDEFLTPCMISIILSKLENMINLYEIKDIFELFKRIKYMRHTKYI